MKILLVANRNRYFPNTNQYREDALRALGHDVVFVDVQERFVPGRVRAWWPLLESMEVSRINARMVRLCRDGFFDLCLVVGGQTVLPATIYRMRACGVPVVLWTTDVPHLLHFQNVTAAAPFYNRVFCAGTEALEALALACAPSWLPFCCEPRCHAPQALDDGDRRCYGRDIAFVGSYYPNRARMLSALADKDIGVWGPLWERMPPGILPATKVFPCRMRYAQWTKAYSAAKIVVVVHYQDGKVPCYQASPKLFEAMACGAFVLCDDQRDARALFKDGEHLVFFKDADDLKRKVDHYLAHPEERERIAAAGRQEVLARHTYAQRMQVLLESVMAKAAS